MLSFRKSLICLTISIKDLYLIPFLHRVRDFIIFNSDVDKNAKTYILKDLDLTDYFGKTSSAFLKDKLNELLVD